MTEETWPVRSTHLTPLFLSLSLLLSTCFFLFSLLVSIFSSVVGDLFIPTRLPSNRDTCWGYLDGSLGMHYYPIPFLSFVALGVCVQPSQHPLRFSSSFIAWYLLVASRRLFWRERYGTAALRAGLDLEDKYPSPRVGNIHSETRVTGFALFFPLILILFVQSHG